MKGQHGNGTLKGARVSEAPVKAAVERMIIRQCFLGFCLTQINISRVEQYRYLRLPGISVKGEEGRRHMINSQDSFLL